MTVRFENFLTFGLANRSRVVDERGGYSCPSSTTAMIPGTASCVSSASARRSFRAEDADGDALRTPRCRMAAMGKKLTEAQIRPLRAGGTIGDPFR